MGTQCLLTDVLQEGLKGVRPYVWYHFHFYVSFGCAGQGVGLATAKSNTWWSCSESTRLLGLIDLPREQQRLVWREHWFLRPLW